MEKEELEVLIEIRDFFRRHKQEIARELGESDNALREALKEIKDTSFYSVTELKRQLVEQSETFKDIINEERDSFIDVSNTVKEQFDKQVKAYPQIVERLEDYLYSSARNYTGLKGLLDVIIWNGMYYRIINPLELGNLLTVVINSISFTLKNQFSIFVI